MARIRKFLVDGGRQLLLGFGIGSVSVLVVLIVWPHSGVTGTLSELLCSPGGSCSAQPVKATVTVTASSLGHQYNWVPPTWKTQSDAGGHYQLDLPAGAYALTAQTDNSYSAAATFAVFANHRTDLDLLLERVFENITGGICLASGDRIATPDGEIPVTQLHVGMMVWTLDTTGHRVAAAIVAMRHLPTPRGFRLLRVSLEDGRIVDVSAGHPTVDGAPVGTLHVGDRLDGSELIGLEFVPYVGDTWDLLPVGVTGAYWANGVALGSTLRMR